MICAHPARLALAALLTTTPLVAQLPRAEQMQPQNAVLTHRQEDPLIKERIQERFETLPADYDAVRDYISAKATR